MARTAYPAGTDLEAYLTVAIPAATGFDTASGAEAGVSIVEALLRRTPILAGTVDDTRVYSPPTERDQILVTDDFISLTSLVYQPLHGNAATLTLGTDFRVGPANEDKKGRPFTRIEFLTTGGFWGGGGGYRWLAPLSPAVINSLTLTGKFGYAASIPSDVWNAMLAAGAIELLPQIAQSLSSGMKTWRSGEDSIGFDTDLTGLHKGWIGIVNQAIRNYRK